MDESLEITFAVVDPARPAGKYMSAEKPGPYISIADPEPHLSMLVDADEIVIADDVIRVLYRYPLGTAGPSLEEERHGGWIFEEVAPDGQAFTRADLARVICIRYKLMYTEEDGQDAPQYAPGLLNRGYTNGKYGIWGHDIGDLLLHTVRLNVKTGLYTLGVDS
jgi:hypothetical protein